MNLSVKEIADKLGVEYKGDGQVIISSAAPIESAVAGQISFLSNPAYKKYLESTKASALAVSPKTPIGRWSAIIDDNPYLLFSRIVDLLYPLEPSQNWTIHPSAVIAPTARLDGHVEIGPHVVIEDKVTIGSGTVIKAGCFIGQETTIGNDCIIGPNVSIMYECKLGHSIIIHAGAVIGSDGFGFAPTTPGAAYKKIRQVGWVEIKDNVELGANVSIDRGAIGPTIIGSGVKVDNLVQIAHNVQIGDNSIIVAQVGISGSAKIGKGVVLAGQVGVVGHIEIGDQATIGAQSGVSRSLEGGRVYFGYPAKPIMESKRIEAAVRMLPDIIKRVKVLEKKNKP